MLSAAEMLIDTRVIILMLV